MAELQPNFSKQTLMISANGYYLRIQEDKVDGVEDIEDKHVVLEMQSVEIGEIVVLGELSKKYIAMDSEGNIITTASLSRDCVFKEKHLTNGYNTYESKANTGWYLGISKCGMTKKGFKTKPEQKSAFFLTGDVKKKKKYN